MSILDLATTLTAPTPAGIGVLLTGFVLGMRHGIHWDHIAAITDITSTTATADVAVEAHEAEHGVAMGHQHRHGGAEGIQAHASPSPGTGPGAMLARPLPVRPAGVFGLLRVERHPVLLGTLYALGHALVVVILGLAVLMFGAALPDWIDPVMSKVVGVTLVILGVYVLVSLYRYARHGEGFRLRSRWMLAFDTVRFGWRRFQARSTATSM